VSSGSIVTSRRGRWSGSAPRLARRFSARSCSHCVLLVVGSLVAGNGLLDVPQAPEAVARDRGFSERRPNCALRFATAPGRARRSQHCSIELIRATSLPGLATLLSSWLKSARDSETCLTAWLVVSPTSFHSCLGASPGSRVPTAITGTDGGSGSCSAPIATYSRLTLRIK
jgi:hypothetical protein